ncbi:CMGC family protein kinase [Tritrichomonas foetus]|uniref:non-specific serine/threonine protein kinase n=1 Tax=Tritrichomonas foetus TaxID=1144522 RepID=A0A1J4JIS8_9EUKA|nr:CMGC family protein kinase [Tritrichomonas foetus]|eukprot:OHS98255.1 CMGC family protein kinase [Tritrichomonas foetus]
MPPRVSCRTDKNRLSSTIRMQSTITLQSSSRKTSVIKNANKNNNIKNHLNNTPQFEYKPLRAIGQGAFGVVYCARSNIDGSLVAIKKVLLDPRYKNRELETLQMVDNRYVIKLKNSFKTVGKKPNEYYLNLVMDYLPCSLHQFNMSYRRERKYPPILYIKLFAYQMFAGLKYLHSIGITHRDLKPQNMLVDPESGELKICDLGSAKILKPTEQSVSYIASRYYRAPELIYDCVYYTPSIDIWAAGCCLAEMLMAGMPIFAGGSSIGQLHEIVKVIGLPSDDDLNSFQHNTNHDLPDLTPSFLESVLPRHTPPDLIDLLKSIFIYNPTKRPTAAECLKHPCFDELFMGDMEMPSKRPFPVLEDRYT